jgi:hypothetical protein
MKEIDRGNQRRKTFREKTVRENHRGKPMGKIIREKTLGKIIRKNTKEKKMKPVREKPGKHIEKKYRENPLRKDHRGKKRPGKHTGGKRLMRNIWRKKIRDKPSGKVSQKNGVSKQKDSHLVKHIHCVGVCTGLTACLEITYSIEGNHIYCTFGRISVNYCVIFGNEFVLLSLV